MCFTIDQINRACGLLLLNEFDTFIYCCKNCTREFESGSHLEVHVLSEHQDNIADAFVHDEVFVENFGSTVVEIGHIKVEPFEAIASFQDLNVEESNVGRSHESNLANVEENHESNIVKPIEPQTKALNGTSVQERVKSSQGSSDEDETPLDDFLVNDDFDNGNSSDEPVEDKVELPTVKKKRGRPFGWRKNTSNVEAPREQNTSVKRSPSRPRGVQNNQERTYSTNDVKTESTSANNGIKRSGRPTTGTFYCEQCPDLKFDGKTNLTRHMRHCHINQMRKCGICNRYPRYTLERHMKRFHSNLAIDAKRPGRPVGLRKNKNGNDVIKSEILKSSVKRPKGRPPGVKNFHYEERTYSTNEIKIESTIENSSSKRMGRPTTGIYYCEMCPDLSFDGKMNLTRHMHHCHIKLMRKCEICNKYPRYGYERHMKKFHTLQPLHKCEYCNAAYKIHVSLMVHIRKHHPESQMAHIKNFYADQPHLCDACGKSFGSLSLYRQHESLVHRKIKKFKCQHCNRSFHKRFLLRDHINGFHTLERPHVCEMCGKSFKTASYLRVHKTIHGEKHLPCRYCDKKFNLWENRYKHEVSVHKIAKPNRNTELC